MVEECKNKPGYLVKEEREGTNKIASGGGKTRAYGDAVDQWCH